MKNTADEAFEKKQFHSARGAYLRASNYHRAAGFFLNENPEDHRFTSAWKISCELFVKAMKLFPYDFEIY